jgi:hypothetical protein
MRLQSLGVALLATMGIACAFGIYGLASRSTLSPPPRVSHLDRIVIIVMENFKRDEVDPNHIGPEQFTPYLNGLGAHNRVALNYFGVTHPSLPNYVAMIAGDFFGISNNNDSCYTPDHDKDCNGVDAQNLVDQLEAANISWEGLFESMPSAGFLGAKFPSESKLYAQKHNPFVYFKNVTSEPTRLAKLRRFVIEELKSELSDPTLASRFIYIVPNQCNDQHGTDGCEPRSLALKAGDAFLRNVVPEITNSPAFTEQSVLFITWDNSAGHESCCGSQKGGGRIPLIAITKRALALRATTYVDHYSLLATIEDGFGFPRLAHANRAATLHQLFPEFVENRAAQ